MDATAELVKILVKLQPEDPIRFISEYYLHAAHGSSRYFVAFKISSQPEKYRNWRAVMGNAFTELLSNDARIPIKTFQQFLSSYCISFEQIHQWLADQMVKELVMDVEFTEFCRYTWVHAFLHDVMHCCRDYFKSILPQRNTQGLFVSRVLDSVLMEMEGFVYYDKAFNFISKLQKTIEQSFEVTESGFIDLLYSNVGALFLSVS